jgi:hypothetical protein
MTISNQFPPSSPKVLKGIRALGVATEEQKDRAVMNFIPEEAGFREILPGRCHISFIFISSNLFHICFSPSKIDDRHHHSGGRYRSHKVWQRVQTAGGSCCLTVLTKQFLLQGILGDSQRIDNNDVTSRTYNVPFYNKWEHKLDTRKKLIISGSGNLKVY